jgi:phage repressor protein C with HTH and peptisase S24 domain
MTKIERVRKLCKWLIYDGYADNDADLAVKMGYTKSSFSQIMNEKVHLSDKFIDKLCLTNENINKVWINKNIGYMLNNDDALHLINEPSSNYDKIENQKGIPLIPIEAMAGFGNGSVTVMDYDTQKYIVPEFTELKTDFMIRVKGSSMYPKYNSGDIVACKKLPLDTFFQWNKVYVLDTIQGAMIKRIHKSTQEGCVICKSDNDKYDPFELSMNDIHALAIVVGVIRLE